MTLVLETVHQVPELTLDMSEQVFENVRMGPAGLEVFPFRCAIPGWSAAERRRRREVLEAVLAGGGAVATARVDGQLAGVASLRHGVLPGDRLQLYTLHVDSRFRRMGAGRGLFLHMEALARDRGARGLVISAAPKASTVAFYLRLGARVAEAWVETLRREEPDDIQMEKLWG
jgi:GNAT superfamily N-acetyltransferase